MNHVDRDLLSRLHVQVMKIEQRQEALVADCRACREERREWEHSLAKEFSAYRENVVVAMSELGAKMVSGLSELEAKLEAHSNTQAPACHEEF